MGLILASFRIKICDFIFSQIFSAIEYIAPIVKTLYPIIDAMDVWGENNYFSFLSFPRRRESKLKNSSFNSLKKDFIDSSGSRIAFFPAQAMKKLVRDDGAFSRL